MTHYAYLAYSQKQNNDVVEVIMMLMMTDKFAIFNSFYTFLILTVLESFINLFQIK